MMFRSSSGSLTLRSDSRTSSGVSAAVLMASRAKLTRKPQRVDQSRGCVRHTSPHLLENRERLPCAWRVGAVREQYHEHIAIGIDPDRRPCPSRMSEGARAEQSSRAAFVFIGRQRLP